MLAAGILTADSFDVAWKIGAATVAVLVAVIGWFIRRHFKIYDDEFEKLSDRANKLDEKINHVVDSVASHLEDYRSSLTELMTEVRREINDVQVEWADLRAHIPEHYLPRADFIRNTILDGKVSALFRKFDRIEIKLDFVKEQLEKRASNRGGEDAA
jgi:tetrahydromethanopterin S-methyltransferase subunit G